MKLKAQQAEILHDALESFDTYAIRKPIHCALVFRATIEAGEYNKNYTRYSKQMLELFDTGLFDTNGRDPKDAQLIYITDHEKVREILNLPENEKWLKYSTSKSAN